MPEFLRRENANQVPANALWLTNICVQVFLVVVFFTSGDPDGMDPYTKMLLLATSMILIPYFWSAAYGLLLTLKGETYENDARERSKDLVIAGIAVAYAVWLLYAGPEVPAAVRPAVCARRDPFRQGQARGRPADLHRNRKLIFAAVVIGALVAAYGLYDGFLTL